MLAPNFHGSFKRERKLMQKRNKDMNKLTEVMAMLINEQPLPPNTKITPCMVNTRDGGNVILNRTGS